jgi:hypothetical protein
MYKSIDSATDMVIATSGSTYINYNRIVSSSVSPYSVVSADSKTFRDPTSNTLRTIRGLYIIDKNNAVALIYDTTNLWSDVATINFLTPSVTYKR